MPAYDYRCDRCDTEFEVDEAMSEHEQVEHKCPSCGTEDVRRVFGGQFVQTSSKT